jgi:hypothetical protein
MMDISDFTDLNILLNSLNDEMFWNNITTDEDTAIFDEFIIKINDSKTWSSSRNREKGVLLEDFSEFIFSRFAGAAVVKNFRPADNESDLEIKFNEVYQPPFMRQYLSPKMICECKNKARSGVDVGMVAKLAELIPGRHASIGIFISLNGISGRGWKYGEGKRKKILLRDKISIISFRVDELLSLRNGSNLYVMIKEKIRKLHDEVDDESPDPSKKTSSDFTKRNLEMITHFKKFKVIDEELEAALHSKIIEIYGEHDDR